MSGPKKFQEYDVLAAARERIRIVFDSFERVYVSFSGGKDSTVMLHLVMDEARRRGVKVGVLIIDLEAQYTDTIAHLEATVAEYRDNIDLHWICAPLLLRNAVSNFQPRWVCWDEDKRDVWVREKPALASDLSQYDFFHPKMEFEEFMVLFGQWYGQGKLCAGFIGIRADESLRRYFIFARNSTETAFRGFKWTSCVAAGLFNVYPIYDWKTRDIWIYHGKFPGCRHNRIYDKMQAAGVGLAQQRLCQPFGDEQRRGLWLYHILEPDTWYKLIARVNGANSGARYVHERGSVSGYGRITKPVTHSWKSFCGLLLRTMPDKTRRHYTARFRKFANEWRMKGYSTIPDAAPLELEAGIGNRGQCWVPSWRSMCRVLLRNDYWCKSLGQAQPKSDAYLMFKELQAKRKLAVE